MIVVGDFNAPHPSRGHSTIKPSGSNLPHARDDQSLTLVTRHRFPTRLGTSTRRDTTPDLTLLQNVANYMWTNTQENLGSDDFVIRTEIPVTTAAPRSFTLTDWDTFCKSSKEDMNTNVHPQHNVVGRQARALAILDRTYTDREATAFVHAAQYGITSTFTIAVVDGNGTLRSFASVKTTTSAKTEKITTAIAMADPAFTLVLTDSGASIRAYESVNDDDVLVNMESLDMRLKQTETAHIS
ncbi:hypothetical protein HPB50_012021 [Hyalomma asiaticum]|uniref:Uncharacterized protein n=1 Tax=Hyalomma asiaticum TaxID=266040 RepID=A0ACB7TGX1_HYAAI|nr:hypothetical protein HPB50_012021 [Hyalomma asiaticum]